MTSKITIKLLKEYLKMNNVNKYRLDEIIKIKDYFNNEIKERKDIIKKLNKYLVTFDYLDKIMYCFVSIIWHVKHSFIRFSSRHTSRYCRFFFDFNIYNRYRYM